jgi:hypothetical protein
MSNAWAYTSSKALKVSDFSMLVDQAAIKNTSPKIAGSISKKNIRSAPAVKTPNIANISRESQKRLDALNKAIEKTLNSITSGFSSLAKPNPNFKLSDIIQKTDNAPVQLKPGNHTAVHVTDHPRVTKNTAPLKARILAENQSAHFNKLPWNKIISSIKNLPEAKVDDPVITSAVEATVKLLESPDFQRDFIKISQKYKSRVIPKLQNQKRGLLAAGPMLIGFFLWPAIHGAISGAAQGAGNSYGQGAGSYAANTFSGAIQGAAQGIQSTLRGD